MAHVLSPSGTLEEILKRLEVKDLIRCKSVCKSWSSLISDPFFIRSHLKHSYHRDRNNEAIAHRRIVISMFPDFLMHHHYNIGNHFFDFNDRHLLGSCDGLVCISPRSNEVVVVNPLTREVMKVPNPQILETGSLSWGFGYDSVKDDYKIVLGVRKGGNCTRFQICSLRSKVWKDVGEVDYTLISMSAILCKGMLYWVTYKKNVILSFHLTEEKFQEIPPPEHRCQLYFGELHALMSLGIMDDGLCIFHPTSRPVMVWVMKDCNNKPPWEMFGWAHEIKYDIVHCIKLLENYIPNNRPLCFETVYFPSWPFSRAPIFVESLVSPHLQEIAEKEAINEESRGQAKK